ncbi:hypothetical protein DSO57_1009754 [Entomophthora muscae]|uniref:Uncharacterized protein n=1 Tax=Entomophthora muscae TaxID=34485 RepID=A0ACC2RLE4_9FUNG|nr:hypothetical protein DSO57_1009754 [Entomophthora muscae]
MPEDESRHFLPHAQQHPSRGSTGRVHPNSNSRLAHFSIESGAPDDSTPSRLRNIEDYFAKNNDSLSDLPSDDVNETEAVLHKSSSMTSMESYASSIMQLSERRPSILSSVPSIPSPSSEDVFGNNDPGRSISPLEGVDFSGGPPMQTSLPETAALARLTCQQVDEMMSLVLAMIRRLDQLDERVTALVPPEHQSPDQQRPDNNPPSRGFDFSSPYTWAKGALIVAFPVVLAATVNYLRTGKLNQKTIRRR